MAVIAVKELKEVTSKLKPPTDEYMSVLFQKYKIFGSKFNIDVINYTNYFECKKMINSWPLSKEKNDLLYFVNKMAIGNVIYGNIIDGQVLFSYRASLVYALELSNDIKGKLINREVAIF